ncbi:hypothetical protein [Actinoplanes friuliensis]|uniref:Uncharacterized protein n=1 Tax=Actinoplanes friuliensis DSM 7358 TaxID=1246995 RepID=U5VU96_9ACTN|nr:hypothetical protein [Actinoplanes friuliensis]AGZ40449.1 hypothetical protein AFR_10800 [Actinoplanes friuliensis DSM 7358]
MTTSSTPRVRRTVLVGPYYAEVVLGYEAAAAGFGSRLSTSAATTGNAENTTRRFPLAAATSPSPGVK